MGWKGAGKEEGASPKRLLSCLQVPSALLEGQMCWGCAGAVPPCPAGGPDVLGLCPVPTAVPGEAPAGSSR